MWIVILSGGIKFRIVGCRLSACQPAGAKCRRYRRFWDRAKPVQMLAIFLTLEGSLSGYPRPQSPEAISQNPVAAIARGSAPLRLASEKLACNQSPIVLFLFSFDKGAPLGILAVALRAPRARKQRTSNDRIFVSLQGTRLRAVERGFERWRCGGSFQTASKRISNAFRTDKTAEIHRPNGYNGFDFAFSAICAR